MIPFTKAQIMGGVAVFLAVGALRRVEIAAKVKIMDVDGPATMQPFPAPDIVQRNGVPITIALLPLAAAYAVNRFA